MPVVRVQAKERIDADGNVVKPLDVQGLLKDIQTLKREKVRHGTVGLGLDSCSPRVPG